MPPRPGDAHDRSRAGTAPPPPPPPPPPAQQGKGSEWQRFVNANPALKPYAVLITRYASQWGVDRFHLAALILWESSARAGARRNEDDGSVSVGLVQINSSRYGETTPFGRVNAANASNPRFSIQYAAYHMSQWMGANGNDLDRFYTESWRGTFRDGKGPSSLIPAKHVPAAGAGIPGSVETSAIKGQINDPFVTVNAKGKLVTVGDPSKAIKYDGLPLTRSQFLGVKRQLEELWVSYTGRRPKDSEIANYLRKGWSTYSLTVALTKDKGFVNSPVFKRLAPAYQEAAKGLLGEGEKLSPDLLRRAIVNNWSGDTFQAVLRKRDGYVRSNEFRGMAETFHNVYKSIYGTPDEAGMNAIKEAALAGWSLDQFAGWLRGQDAYTRSNEYQSKALSFLEQIGLLTGNTAVLKPGAAPPAGQHPSGQNGLPDDRRIPGQGAATPQSSLVPGLI
jgi:Transglycosylase SLT domain